MNKKVLNSDELDKLLKPDVKAPEYAGTRISKKFKNSLDSDEEDDEENAKKYNVFNPDEFDGHEEATIERDGEITITPFNMKEELEEGYFDKDGTYIFQKDEDEVKDQWLDDIDWVKVKNQEDKRSSKKRQLSESDSDDLPELDVVSHYKKMLNIMESGETVLKAIRRLGGNNSSKKNKLNRKKEEALSEEEKEKMQKSKEKLQELTELASELLQSGDTDVYDLTFEKLTYLIKSKEAAKSSLYESNDAAGDMFADDFDADAQVPVKSDAGESGNTSTDSEVMWEFKWENKDDATVHGPHSTTEMLNWTQEGYFTDGVYVRQAGKANSDFYSSKRMDFELYL